MDDGSRWRWPQEFKDADFVRRVLICIGLAAFSLLIWNLSGVFLLAFGAVLVAVILHSFAGVLARRTPVPGRWSLMVAGLLIFAGFLVVSVLFGAQVRAEIASVSERLPFALNSFTRELGLGNVTEQLPQILGTGPGGGFIGRLAGVGATIIGGLADFLLVIISGCFIASDPKVYRDGLVKLFPPSQHERIRSSLDASGQALRLWLGSQLIAMSFVGISAGVGLWLIGLPSPFALGLLAGLLDFVPFVGPVLGALPAVLIASTIDGATVLWTILLFVVIQQLEGNIIFPLVGKRMVSLPPALALFSIVASGVLFGSLGFVLGYPLAVVAFVLVKKLYVRETLGEETPVPGEEETPVPGEKETPSVTSL